MITAFYVFLAWFGVSCVLAALHHLVRSRLAGPPVDDWSTEHIEWDDDALRTAKLAPLCTCGRPLDWFGSTVCRRCLWES